MKAALLAILALLLIASCPQVSAASMTVNVHVSNAAGQSVSGVLITSAYNEDDGSASIRQNVGTGDLTDPMGNVAVRYLGGPGEFVAGNYQYSASRAMYESAYGNQHVTAGINSLEIVMQRDLGSRTSTPGYFTVLVLVALALVLFLKRRQLC